MLKPMVSRDTRIVRSPQVLSRVIDEEAVLLNLGTGTYCGMNEVATRAWELIGEGISFGGLCDQLGAEFDADGEKIQADLSELLDSLLNAKLVVVT